MDQDHSDAHELNTQGLLLAAARLIERVLIKLDVQSAPCPHCATTLFHDREAARVYEQLTDTPDKLRRLADRLDKSRTPAGVPRSTSIGFRDAMVLKERA